MKAKIIRLAAVALIVLAACAAAAACSVNGNVPTLLSVQGAALNGKKVLMVVDEDVESVNLTGKVEVSKGATWALYYDAYGAPDGEAITKVAASADGALAKGDNKFYIVVQNKDGGLSSTYELLIHRKHETIVEYCDGDPGNYSLLNAAFVYSGGAFEADFVPDTPAGYNFAGWKTKDDKDFTSTSFLSESIRLFADFQPITYSVEYNPNTGTGAMAASKHFYGRSQTLKTNTFTRTGYDFAGWNTEPDGKGDSYSDNEVIGGTPAANLADTQDETVRLYAQWEPQKHTIYLLEEERDSYTVTFDTVGGDSIPPAVQTVTMASGLCYPDIPTKAGYIFTGWYKSGVTAPFDFAAQVMRDETLFAGWTPASYYSIGNINGTSPTYQLTGTTPIRFMFVPLASSEVTFSSANAGNTVCRLYDNYSGNSLAYDNGTGPGNNFKLTYNVILGRHYYLEVSSRYSWSYDDFQINIEGAELPQDGGVVPAISYQVLFDIGEGIGTTPEAQTVTYSSPLKYPEIPQRNGYAFVGWYDNNEYTGSVFNFSSIVTKDTVLYAKWTKTSHKVLPVNGISEEFSYGSQNVFQFTYAALRSGPVIFEMQTDASKVKMGFSAGVNGHVLVSSLNAGLHILTVTFLARPGESGTFRIKTVAALPADGGSVAISALSTVTAEYGLPISSLGLPPYAKTGYVFEGWWTEPDGEGTMYTSATQSALTSSSKLYLHWEPITYRIVFYNNGADSGTMSDMACVYDQPANLTANAFVKAGYDFAGWTDSYSRIFADAEEIVNLTANHNATVYLYAQWVTKIYSVGFYDSAKPSKTVVFDISTNGGTGVKPVDQTVTATQGLKYPAAPRKTGEVFVGWFNDPVSGSVPFDFSAHLTQDETLYARWKPIPSNTNDILNITGESAKFGLVGTFKLYLTYVALADGMVTFETNSIGGDFRGRLTDEYGNVTISERRGGAGVGDYNFKASAYLYAGTIYTLELWGNDNHQYADFTVTTTGVMPKDGGISSLFALQSIRYGESYFLPSPSVFPPGYNAFEGWYTGQTGSGIKINLSDIWYYDLPANIILYPNFIV